MPRFEVRRLDWSDEQLGTISLPERPLEIAMGLGSGLARRAGDPPGIVWAVGDRGPNLKPKVLVKRYGVEAMRELAAVDGAKVMPRLDLGPAIARLRVSEDRVELLKVIRISDCQGAPLSGLPPSAGEHGTCEPAFDLEGRPLDPDPSGLDTEGILARADGGFWVGDEFGPSLVRVDAGGRVETRFVPKGVALAGATYPVDPRLPALAARRKLNRGFEAIALSADERWLYLAFQSPLAHPDEAVCDRATHVRLWKLDAHTLTVAGQYLYPLDPPDTFRRDAAKGGVECSDLKICELAWLGEDRLLVLERGSETTKIYRLSLDPTCMLAAEHLDVATAPTVEQLSAAGEPALSILAKELIFTSDDAPELSADMEGMAVLSERELLLVNDNDFGVEGVATAFWRIRFAEPVLT